MAKVEKEICTYPKELLIRWNPIKAFDVSELPREAREFVNPCQIGNAAAAAAAAVKVRVASSLRREVL